MKTVQTQAWQPVQKVCVSMDYLTSWYSSIVHIQALSFGATVVQIGGSLLAKRLLFKLKREFLNSNICQKKKYREEWRSFQHLKSRYIISTRPNHAVLANNKTFIISWCWKIPKYLKIPKRMKMPASHTCKPTVNRTMPKNVKVVVSQGS